jgi:hypothetical protein
MVTESIVFYEQMLRRFPRRKSVNHSAFRQSITQLSGGAFSKASQAGDRSAAESVRRITGSASR